MSSRGVHLDTAMALDMTPPSKGTRPVLLSAAAQREDEELRRSVIEKLGLVVADPEGTENLGYKFPDDNCQWRYFPAEGYWGCPQPTCTPEVDDLLERLREKGFERLIVNTGTHGNNSGDVALEDDRLAEPGFAVDDEWLLRKHGLPRNQLHRMQHGDNLAQRPAGFLNIGAFCHSARRGQNGEFARFAVMAEGMPVLTDDTTVLFKKKVTMEEFQEECKKQVQAAMKQPTKRRLPECAVYNNSGLDLVDSKGNVILAAGEGMILYDRHGRLKYGSQSVPGVNCSRLEQRRVVVDENLPHWCELCDLSMPAKRAEELAQKFREAQKKMEELQKRPGGPSLEQRRAVALLREKLRVVEEACEEPVTEDCESLHEKLLAAKNAVHSGAAQDEIIEKKLEIEAIVIKLMKAFDNAKGKRLATGVDVEAEALVQEHLTAERAEDAGLRAVAPAEEQQQEEKQKKKLLAQLLEEKLREQKQKEVGEEKRAAQLLEQQQEEKQKELEKKKLLAQLLEEKLREQKQKELEKKRAAQLLEQQRKEEVAKAQQKHNDQRV